MDNNIAGNVARSGNGGGLLACGTVDSFIARNRIHDNVAAFRNTGGNGGGLAECPGHIWNNMIYNNRAKSTGSGGGLFQCNQLFHNTIAFNAAAVGGGTDACTTISHCIVWGNSTGQINGGGTPNFSCIQGWAGGGTGNIVLDPQFVKPKADNYRLKETSPCAKAVVVINEINQDLAADFEGDPRALPVQIPDTTTLVSIGADELPE